MEDFPSNSRHSQAAAKEPAEEKPVLRVISEGSKVTRKPPSLGRRIKEMFVGGETKGLFEYIVGDVLAPAFRDMMHDAVIEGTERAIYGGRRSSSRRSDPRRGSSFGNVTPINYSRYSRPSETRPPSPRRLNMPAFEDIIMDSRIEAEKVLDILVTRVQDYEFVPVRVLYELIGEPFHHTDEKHGWYDLSSAFVKRVSGGYLLVLPRPEPRG